MRMIVDFNLPLEPFNSLVKNGTAGQKLQQILEEIKPEAIYFSERNGQRGGIMIVDVADVSKVPGIAEPLFLTFEANVQFRVAMTPDDLARAGLDELGKKWG